MYSFSKYQRKSKSNLHARRLPLEGSGNQLHGLLLYKTKGHVCSVLRNVNVQVCASHNRQNASKLGKSSRHEDRATSSVKWPRACHLPKATSLSSHIIFARPVSARLWRSHCKTFFSMHLVASAKRPKGTVVSRPEAALKLRSRSEWQHAGPRSVSEVQHELEGWSVCRWRRRPATPDLPPLGRWRAARRPKAASTSAEPKR